MSEGPFNFSVMVIPTTASAVLLPWPPELDEQQRQDVLLELSTRLEQDGIWIQPEDAGDQDLCLLRAEEDTWTDEYMRVFGALSNVLSHALRKATGDKDLSVNVGFAG